jgi:hypothetical protein
MGAMRKEGEEMRVARRFHRIVFIAAGLCSITVGAPALAVEATPGIICYGPVQSIVVPSEGDAGDAIAALGADGNQIYASEVNSDGSVTIFYSEPIPCPHEPEAPLPPSPDT